MQPNNNRPPDEAEDHADDAIDGAFKPGDSFSNDPSDQGGSGELPSWLQNFADVAGESGSGQPEGATAPGEHAVTPPAAVPAQAPVSREQPAAAAPQPQPTNVASDPFTQAPAGNDASFLSEDDLPEWLRALNTESEPTAGTAPAAAMPVASATPNGTLQVPPISRAWVTASDQPEVSPAANLMSSLVNVIDSRPDAVAVEPAVAAPAPPPSAPAAATSKAAAPVSAAPATADEPKRRNRTRTLLIAAIIILVLIIIVLLFGS